MRGDISLSIVYTHVMMIKCRQVGAKSGYTVRCPYDCIFTLSMLELRQKTGDGINHINTTVVSSKKTIHNPLIAHVNDGVIDKDD